MVGGQELRNGQERHAACHAERQVGDAEQPGRRDLTGVISQRRTFSAYGGASLYLRTRSDQACLCRSARLYAMTSGIGGPL